jgi:hypothetical protein
MGRLALGSRKNRFLTSSKANSIYQAVMVPSSTTISTVAVPDLLYTSAIQAARASFDRSATYSPAPSKYAQSLNQSWDKATWTHSERSTIRVGKTNNNQQRWQRHDRFATVYAARVHTKQRCQPWHSHSTRIQFSSGRHDEVCAKNPSNP